MKPYRSCVVAVIINESGHYLVGERINNSGSWQFPQGGVDDGETYEQALFRELKEEVGCSDIEIIREAEENVSYLFPEDLNSSIKNRFCGQSQRWFLCRYQAGKHPNLSIATDKEFGAIDWKSAESIVEGIVYWKKSAYLQGLKLLGIAKEG